MGTKHLLGTGRAYKGKESFKAGLTGQGPESHGRREEYAAVQGLRAQAFVSVGEASGFQTPMQPLPGYCHRNWPFGGYSVTYLSGIILKHQASQLRLGKVPEQLNLLF